MFVNSVGSQPVIQLSNSKIFTIRSITVYLITVLQSIVRNAGYSLVFIEEIYGKWLNSTGNANSRIIETIMAP